MREFSLMIKSAGIVDGFNVEIQYPKKDGGYLYKSELCSSKEEIIDAVIRFLNDQESTG